MTPENSCYHRPHSLGQDRAGGGAGPDPGLCLCGRDLNLVGVNGTLSAQMEIAGINGAVIALVLGLLVLAGGLLLGTPFAYVVGALATYLVSNSNYGSYELSMMAVGAAIAMSMFLALRGSLAETVGETLGVTGVTGTEVVKRNIIFTLVLTAAIVVFLVAGSSLKFLMI